MRIQKIKIHSFGKLKDFSLSFEDGMNVLFGENEAGKSTVLAFIKAMLYGFSGSKRSISENERLKYMPWDGSKMGGELYFESARTKHGCIRRTFGKTARGDTCKVFDDMTGEELPLADAGEGILEMNADTFCKTAFVKQLGSGISGKADDEIAKKMMNLEQSADEEVSYSRTKDCLLAQKRTLKTIGNRGKIPVLESELIQLQEEAAKAQRREQKSLELLQTQNRLTAEKEELEQKLALAEQQAWQADCIKIQGLHQRLEKLQLQIEKFGQIPERAPQDERRKNELLNRLQSAENEIAVLKAQKKICEEQKPEQFELVRDRIEQLRSEQNNLQDTGHKNSPLLLVLGFLLLAAGILAGLFIKPLCYLISIAGIGSLLWYGFSMKRAIRSENNAKLELEQEILELFSKIQVTNFEEYDKIQNEYTEMSLKLRLLEEQLKMKEELKGQAEQDLAAFRTELEQVYGRKDAFDRIEQMKQELESLDKLRSEKELLGQSMELIADGRPIELFLKERAAEPVEALADSESIQKRSMDLVREIADCEHALSELERERPLSLIQGEIAARQEELREYQQLYTAFETAENEIDEAYKALENEFRPKLNALAGEHFQKITGGCYGSVRVSKDFKVLLECGNELRELDYMSGGTADQFYFALRTAFLELMETGEAIPLFLDDTFVQFDAKRTQNAFAFLMNQKTQILYFTCKKDILDLARQNSIHCMEVLS